MFNNISLLLFVAAIITAHLMNKRKIALSIAAVYTFLAPVMVIGERRMNSNYLLTAALLILLVSDLFRRREVSRPRRQIAVYGGAMGIVLGMMTLGFVLYGTAGFTAFLMSMAGHVNIILLTLLFTIYASSLTNRDLVSAGKIVVLTFIISQALMIAYQKLFFESAYYFTWYTYAGDSHYGPLRTMIVTWLTPYFYRAFGTFYSPTILGMLSLLLTAVLAMIGVQQQDRKTSRRLMLASLATATIGAFSLTKSFMLGIMLLAVYIALAVYLLSKDKKQQLKRWIQIPVVVIISLGVAYFVVPEEGKPNRDYYYSFILNPFSAFDSRYQPVDPPDVTEDHTGGFIPPDTETPPEEGGVLVDAMEVVREHWLTGVGPVAIRGEFTGDSELLRVIHDGGIISVFAYIACFGYFFLRAVKHKLTINLVMIPVIALGSLALNFLTLNTSPLFMAVVLICDDVERRGGLLTYTGENPFDKDSPALSHAE